MELMHKNSMVLADVTFIPVDNQNLSSFNQRASYAKVDCGLLVVWEHKKLKILSFA